MKVDKIVHFSVQDEGCFSELDRNIENSQFTKVHFKFYSNEMNAHGFICDIDVLKKYAPTIAGKPILARINQYANNGQGDFAGHEYDEIAVGFFPLKGLELTYEVGDNGTLYACADGYIWNMYYEDVVKILCNYGGVKSVSSEVKVIDSEIISEDKEIILRMSFTGVTLLGERNMNGFPISPAVKGCEGKIVNFSFNDMQKEFASEKTKFEKVLYSKIDESSKDDSFLMEKEKEVKMSKVYKDVAAQPKLKENTQEAVKNDADSLNGETKLEGDKDKKSNLNTKDDSQKVDNAIGEDDMGKNNSSRSAKSDDSNTELKDALDKCKKLQDENDRLKEENKKLAEYKNEKEKQSVKKKVDIALNNVSSVLNQKDLDNFRKRSANCSMESVDSFINEIKAFAFDVKDKKGQKQTDLMRCSISSGVDHGQKEPDNAWDRIAQKFN